jgi:hypothetical protein
MAPDVRARLIFYGLLAGLVMTLAVICAWEPVQGDGWGHFVDARDPLTWERFSRFARVSYLEGNPRWGQLALVLAYNSRFVAIVVSPLMIVAVLLGSMTLIRARWPRPSEPADAWLLLQVFATAVATMPQFGAIWFYRPNCTNYIYPLVVQLLWLVPYRLFAVRPSTSSRGIAALAAPGMLVLGAIAGAGNEHMGLGLGVAAGLGICAGWRRDRSVPVWAITGVIGLAAGYVALLTAPGQMMRYGGMAAEHSLIGGVIARGVFGNLAVLGRLLAWSSPMLIVLVLVARGALWDRAVWTRPLIRDVGAFLAVAAVMFATLMVSPRQASQLLLAPITMIELALGAILVELGKRHQLARRIRIASTAIAAIALIASLVIYGVTGREARGRLALLETAAPGSTVRVPAFTFSAPTPFAWGDDFRSALVTDRVARMFGLARVEWIAR